MKRILPPSSQSHERPSSIWTRVRQRKLSGSRASGIDPELLEVRGRARGDEPGEILGDRGAEARLAGLRRLAQHVDRLAGPVVARRREELARALPQLADGALVADDHPRPRPRRRLPEDAAALARGDDVRARVTEGRERPVLALDRDEPAEPAAGDVLEEDPLDRILRAEREDLLDPRHGEHPRHANG